MNSRVLFNLQHTSQRMQIFSKQMAKREQCGASSLLARPSGRISSYAAHPSMIAAQRGCIHGDGCGGRWRYSAIASLALDVEGRRLMNFLRVYGNGFERKCINDRRISIIDLARSLSQRKRWSIGQEEGYRNVLFKCRKKGEKNSRLKTMKYWKLKRMYIPSWKSNILAGKLVSYASQNLLKILLKFWKYKRKL